MKKIKLQVNEGYTIVVNQFTPKTDNQKVVIIVPAMGVKQIFYERFANFLKEQNYTVYTFDYSGIGESKFHSLKDYEKSISDWINYDFETVIQYVKLNHSASKLILIGHSLGGQVIALNKYSYLAYKIILISSQSGYWKFWKGVNKYIMLFYWKLFFPIVVKYYGYLPSDKFSRMESLPKGVATEWSNWGLKPNYFLHYISEDSHFFNKINCPIYSYSSSDDTYAPKDSVDWLASIFKNSTVIKKHLNPNDLNLNKIGHFGFFKEENKFTIWNLILNDIE
ncbi:alpha/beta fold hydrolase [Gaetbulibacter sp. M235]|uniref:alpha/beta hydrolase family protein n=1 Tax=Gaetbulibacter sp. M235 TaxID=3126510 RepID=UPI00374F415D